MGLQNFKMMKHLTLAQRYTIEILLRQQISNANIADIIRVNKSSISREIRRNCDQRNGTYKAELAHSKAEKRHLEKAKNIRLTSEVIEHIRTKLSLDYSPEQIVGNARKDQINCVSVETIYTHIWNDKRSKGELYLHLRTRGKRYQKRGNSKARRGSIVNRVGIEHRPAIVDQKLRLGDIEMDLIVGQAHKGVLLTINDRVTGMLKMAKLDNKEASTITQKAIELLADWKPFLNTITTDNGKEFAYHEQIAQSLNIDYFFARPYHSWERGANENLNGLVRQYFPKKYNFDLITDQDVIDVVNKLNSRPRKRFEFNSPNEIFSQWIQNTQLVHL